MNEMLMNKCIKKAPPFLPHHFIEDLEEKLIEALYEQRSYEYEILKYTPESSAPQELRDAFCAARVRVNEIEASIRIRKYGF